VRMIVLVRSFVAVAGVAFDGFSMGAHLIK